MHLGYANCGIPIHHHLYDMYMYDIVTQFRGMVQVIAFHIYVTGAMVLEITFI